MLDLGCGVGEYVRAFARQGAEAYGCDIELSRLVDARKRGTGGGLRAAGEALPFRPGSLDVIVLNEVIEHVDDDRATMAQVAEALAPDGVAIMYAPNRLYPFETHGVRVRGRYIFGNIPFVNWLPRKLRDRLVPHARVYGAGDWQRVLSKSDLEIVHHSYVYPGFDNIEARLPRLGKLLKAVCYRAEQTPLRRFGLSHFLVLRHAGARGTGATA